MDLYLLRLLVSAVESIQALVQLGFCYTITIVTVSVPQASSSSSNQQPLPSPYGLAWSSRGLLPVPQCYLQHLEVPICLHYKILFLHFSFPQGQIAITCYLLLGFFVGPGDILVFLGQSHLQPGPMCLGFQDRVILVCLPVPPWQPDSVLCLWQVLGRMVSSPSPNVADFCCIWVQDPGYKIFFSFSQGGQLCFCSSPGRFLVRGREVSYSSFRGRWVLVLLLPLRP